MTANREPKITQKRPATVKDIARISQTSPSTVSRVLTGIVPVAPDKREAVLEAIASLNFRPNSIARSLKTKSTRSLGLIINDVLNPFYGAVVRGVEQRAASEGYALILCNTNELPERELQSMLMLRDKFVDGIIMAPTGINEAAMRNLIGEGVSLVQVDRRIPGIRASSVTVDNERGGYLAAKHLLQNGHRHIDFITYDINQMTVAQREIGYRAAMVEYGAADFVTSCRLSFDLADTLVSVAALFQRRTQPSALIAANNQIALAVMRALKALRIQIGTDVSIVVFDDLEVFELLDPPLTAVAQPAFEIGFKAAEFLLSQIASPARAAEQHDVLLPSLVVRGSSPVL